MPTSSGVEPGQKRTLRRPSALRTSSSNSDPLHYRSKTDRSPRLGGIDRRSLRGTQSDPPVNQKKQLGTRIADLESQLGQAQEELKSLKGQLVSDQDAKKAAQEQIERKTKKPAAPSKPTDIQVKKSSQKPKRQESKRENNNICIGELPEENQHETDVFEVPVEKVAIVDPVELSEQTKDGDFKLRAENVSILASLESEKLLPFHDAIPQKNEEISTLKAILEEREKELGEFVKENESLKIQMQEKSSKITAVQSKEEEITSRLNQVINELEESKNNTFQINVKLEASERMNVALETEMKKLRVQTEQWRKAADAAAAVLSGDVEMNGRRVSERCGSMDNHIGRVIEAPGGGYGNGHTRSPSMIDDTDDIFDSSKRKGSGIRMFGDLWKKKGQK